MLESHLAINATFSQNKEYRTMKKSKVNKAADYNGMKCEFFKFARLRTFT